MNEQVILRKQQICNAISSNFWYFYKFIWQFLTVWRRNDFEAEISVYYKQLIEQC